MKGLLPALLLLCATTWAQTAAPSATATLGPTQAWNVFTLPNPTVTPNWRNYAPPDCTSNFDACADDNRFWEEWNFNTDFGSAIDSSFKAVASQGKYQSVMLLMPLADVEQASAQWEHFSSNIQLMYTTAAANGVKLEPVLFPKWKYGAEWCYLYPSNAPSACDIVPGSNNGMAVAYQKLVQMMDFVQTLGGSCIRGSFHSPFAVWYGWQKSELPSGYDGYQVLANFWESLPTSASSQSGCDLQASYITWLDSGYAGNPEVQQFQSYVVNQLHKPYWVNTELYSTSQIQQYYNTYTPYQTIITGYWHASNIRNWARGMCSQWNTAAQPARLGVWTFDDRDVDPPYELYRSYINRKMAVVGSICSY